MSCKNLKMLFYLFKLMEINNTSKFEVYFFWDFFLKFVLL